MIHRLEDIFGAMILVLVVIGIILVAIDEYFRVGSRHVTAKWQKKERATAKSVSSGPKQPQKPKIHR